MKEKDMSLWRKIASLDLDWHELVALGAALIMIYILILVA